MIQQGVVRGLQYSPVIATRLGIFVAEFANIEMALPGVLSRILRISHDAAEIVLNGVDSIDIRRSIVEESLKASDIPEPEKEKFQGWLSAVKGIITQRNKYVHATYAVDLDNDRVTMHTHVHSNRKNKENKQITVEMLDGDIQNIRKCLGDLLNIIAPDSAFSLGEDVPLLPSGF